MADLVAQERPIVSVLDADLEGNGSHCSQCLRQLHDGDALKPDGDRLASAFCSKECEAKLKVESQSLLFGPEYAIPIELNPNEDSGFAQKRDDAQTAFARFIRESGRIHVTLVARFIARQVVNETVKLLPPGHPSAPTENGEWTGHGYTLFDHMERVRFLELNANEDEAEQLRAILKANLQGLEEFVTNERYTVLIGKLAYNAYGISFAGGRDDKVRYTHLRAHTQAHLPFLLTAPAERQTRRRRVDANAQWHCASSGRRILRRFILRKCLFPSPIFCS